MEKYLRKFIIYTFLSFIILIGVFMFVFDMPAVGKLLQVLGAWTSTFVFIFLVKKIYPEDNLWNYI